MIDNKNPISPHLQIYRWHISSLLSITHRISGIINLVALILIFFWLIILIPISFKVLVGIFALQFEALNVEKS